MIYIMQKYFIYITKYNKKIHSTDLDGIHLFYFESIIIFNKKIL